MTNNRVRVPWERIPESQQRAIVESVVLREGTDYGLNERSFDSKVKALMETLKRGDAILTYDANLDSFNVVTKDTFYG